MPARTRIDDLKKKSHSEKRSSLQTNFLPCGEIKYIYIFFKVRKRNTHTHTRTRTHTHTHTHTHRTVYDRPFQMFQLV